MIYCSSIQRYIWVLNLANFRLQTNFDILLSYPKYFPLKEYKSTHKQRKIWFLALRNDAGNYSLNGDFQIQAEETEVPVAGTVFEYDKREDNGDTYERLTAKGPITENLIIAVSLCFSSIQKSLMCLTKVES